MAVYWFWIAISYHIYFNLIEYGQSQIKQLEYLIELNICKKKIMTVYWSWITISYHIYLGLIEYDQQMTFLGVCESRFWFRV